MLHQYVYGCCGLITGYVFLTVVKRKRDNPKTSYLMGLLNVLLSPLSFFKIGPFKHGRRINLVSGVE